MITVLPLALTVSRRSLVTTTDEPRACTCTLPNCGHGRSGIASQHADEVVGSRGAWSYLLVPVEALAIHPDPVPCHNDLPVDLNRSASNAGRAMPSIERATALCAPRDATRQGVSDVMLDGFFTPLTVSRYVCTSKEPSSVLLHQNSPCW